MGAIKNDNVFMVNVGSKMPELYSTFNKAEQVLLGDFRQVASIGSSTSFHNSITCIQVDTNLNKRIDYKCDITVNDEGHNVDLVMHRDEKSWHGYKAEWRETLLLNLDYTDERLYR